jgi:hypothetical protein
MATHFAAPAGGSTSTPNSFCPRLFVKATSLVTTPAMPAMGGGGRPSCCSAGWLGFVRQQQQQQQLLHPAGGWTSAQGVPCSRPGIIQVACVVSFATNQMTGKERTAENRHKQLEG